MARKIDVTIRVNGTAIECDHDGGNAHLKRGDQMRWHIDDTALPFTIAFSNFDTGAAASPFGVASIGPTLDTGWRTVTNANTQYCKYAVSIRGCHPLDPIIIVDKSRNIPIGRKTNRKASGKSRGRRITKRR